MIASTDWTAVAEQHRSDGSGGCSCGEAACRIRAAAEQQCRADEQRLLPGPPPLSRPFISVFAPGEVER